MEQMKGALVKCHSSVVIWRNVLAENNVIEIPVMCSDILYGSRTDTRTIKRMENQQARHFAWVIFSWQHDIADLLKYQSFQNWLTLAVFNVFSNDVWLHRGVWAAICVFLLYTSSPAKVWGAEKTFPSHQEEQRSEAASRDLLPLHCFQRRESPCHSLIQKSWSIPVFDQKSVGITQNLT